MARGERTETVSAAALAVRCAPRDDHIVLERPAADQPDGDGLAFEAVEGPFHRYRRSLSWREVADGRFELRTEVAFSLAMTVFGWIYVVPVRRELLGAPRTSAAPWWNLPDRLDARRSEALSAMCTVCFVAGLMFAFLTNVLTFAASDIGSGTAAEQANITAVTRVGAVLTLVILAMADRVGRRRVAVWTAAAAVALTGASALSPTLAALTVLQTLSRNLAITSMTAAEIVVMEELPAGSRASAAGLGALSWGAGSGLVVLALPLAGVGAAGWRLVFAVALLALPLVVVAARALPESVRYMASVAEVTTTARRHRIRPLRFVVVSAMFFLLNAIVAPSSQLQNDYLRVDRGFPAARISLFIVITGTPALLGVLAGSRIADRRGRRVVLGPGLVVIAVSIAAFFLTSGATMWVVATIGGILGTVAVPAMGVLGTELFPTSRRGQARGGVVFLATAGSAVGLVVAGVLVDSLGYGAAFTWLALAPLTAAGLALLVPETRGLELEALNEDADQDARPAADDPASRR